MHPSCSYLTKTENQLKTLKDKAKEIITALENKLEKKINEANELQDAFDQQKEENNMLNTQLAELNANYQKELCEKQASIEKLTNENERLLNAADALSTSKAQYEQKYKESELKNGTLLNQIKEKTDDLSSKYNEQIKSLENQLSEAQELVKTAHNEIEGFSDLKKQLQLQNARLTVSNRTFKMLKKQFNMKKKSQMEKLNLLLQFLKQNLILKIIILKQLFKYLIMQL